MDQSQMGEGGKTEVRMLDDWDGCGERRQGSGSAGNERGKGEESTRSVQRMGGYMRKR